MGIPARFSDHFNSGTHKRSRIQFKPRRNYLDWYVRVHIGVSGTDFFFFAFCFSLASVNLLCVPFGSFVSGLLTEPLGKRRVMQVS